MNDRRPNQTSRVSVLIGAGSTINSGDAKSPAISGDGKVIAFVTSVAFDPNDTNNADDVNIHDRTANQTSRVSVFTGSGSINNSGGAKTPAISGDGNVIAFVTSVAFDPNDT